MKKNTLIALIVVCMLAITGCGGNKKYDEMMSEGRDLIVSGNYEEALECFEAALEEKEGDEEATNFYDQVKKLMQVEANIDSKLYKEAIALCDKLISSKSNDDIIIDAAKKLKKQAEDLKTEQENTSLKEDITKRLDEVKALMNQKQYMNAKTKLNYILEEINGKEDFEQEIAECNKLIEECNKKLDEIAKEEESYEVEFNDELKSQIAAAGKAYVEYYFVYGENTSPSQFANDSYEMTENDTPLGEHKEEGRKIFVNAFKQAFEATGNKYY